MDHASPQALLAQALIEVITELPGEIGLERAVASAARVLSVLDSDMSALEVAPREQVPQPMNASSGSIGSAVVWDSIRARVNAICRGRLRALMLQRLHQRGFCEETARNTPSPRKPLLLLSPTNRLGAPVRCVRPAIGSDLPALRHFCRDLLALLDAHPRSGKGPDHYELLQDFAAFRWRSILETKQPLAVGIEDGRVVGVGTVWIGRLVEIFVEPTAEADFFAVLLEGCVQLAARRGGRRLEAEVHYSNYTDFGRAGWSPTDTAPLWSFDIRATTET
ncbi:GNAT family N-acetyltransferase [Azospirillum sp. TSH58]|uniref:GNAT family N-acetyltransferase n=1 Tax=Azospirillum sp. TSH58 TaxID=664962 RepID=UPI001FFF82EB|nr:hypothetical protein [Azospirillum sp. TSH58]